VLVSEENLNLMHRIDEIYTKCPFYGYPRMTKRLQNEGYMVNHKRIYRLMQVMGIQAVFPKQNTSKPNLEHRIFPYLLNQTPALAPNHIWGTDITYIRLSKGFCYLVALLDWFSRYVVAWELSPTLDMDFCLKNLGQALSRAVPQIHNSDQGSHFTSPRYTALLTQAQVQISMDGRGRCMDNIFTERLWRTVKYEEVYLKEYHNFSEAHASLSQYFQFYNHERLHSSLDYQTPAAIYYGKSSWISHTY
jgi:putative transposase